MTARKLGLDVALAHLGIVVVEGREVIHHETVYTEKDSSRRGVRVADDDADRCRILAQGLARVIEEYKPSAAFVELPTGGAQGGRAHRAMGLATGAVVATLVLHGVPAEYVTPRQSKIAATGVPTATKEMVQEAVKRHFAWREPLSDVSSKAEHEADAAAAVWAAEGGMLDSLVRQIGGVKA